MEKQLSLYRNSNNLFSIEDLANLLLEINESAVNNSPDQFIPDYENIIIGYYKAYLKHCEE